MSYPQSFFLDY